MLIIKENKDTPIYVQLYKQLRDKIISGELKPKEKMPSTRTLSLNLNISRNTVDLAYHQLSSEGYLISEPRKGFFVESVDFSPISSVTGGEKPATVVEKALETHLERPHIQYDFKYGMLSPKHLPISRWQNLMNKCIRENEKNMSFYGPTFGELDLREEILKYLRLYRGVECSVDQIFIGSGVHYCLSMLSQILIQSTSSVAMENPGYHITRSTFKNHEFDVKAVPLDSKGLNVNLLSKEKVGAVYVTPSHQYPKGHIMPISRRIELINWAHKSEALIIEDDYSCHLR